MVETLTEQPKALTDDAATQAEALTGRLFLAHQEALDLVMVYIGDRLGLYRALGADGPATAAELASRAGIHQRYAREWLEQQAVTRIVEVDEASVSAEERRFSLPRGHAESLIDPESPFSITPLARVLVASIQVLPKLLEAYRTGGGVSWDDYGPDGYEGQADFNRPWLLAQRKSLRVK